MIQVTGSVKIDGGQAGVNKAGLKLNIGNVESTLELHT